ncbi:MAG: aldo/keto reductase, partial [Planctomycetes bacterium]|nr:aldo/keto reductase [Planctomycetota bacterium]
GLGGLAYSPLMRGMLFGTWIADKTFPPGDTRAEHKDYRGARFARHLQAIDEMKAIAAGEDLSLPQLAIGALMCTPGLTACIVGARNAAQGVALADLGAPIRAKPLAALDAVCARLATDLAGMT